MGWGHFLAALILETMMLQQGKYIHHSGMMLDNRGHFLFGFLSWQLMHFRFWTQRVTFGLNTYHQSDDRRWPKPWPTPRSASWPTPRPGTSGIRNFSPWWDGTALKSLLCLILYYNKTQKIPGFELNREISRNPCPRLNPWYSMIMIRTKRWFKNYAIRAVLHSCDVLQEKKMTVNVFGDLVIL